MFYITEWVAAQGRVNQTPRVYHRWQLIRCFGLVVRPALLTEQRLHETQLSVIVRLATHTRGGSFPAKTWQESRYCWPRVPYVLMRVKRNKYNVLRNLEFFCECAYVLCGRYSKHQCCIYNRIKTVNSTKSSSKTTRVIRWCILEDMTSI